jgi:hypothetical protein
MLLRAHYELEMTLGGFMETAELKGMIGDLEARVVKIRDWL